MCNHNRAIKFYTVLQPEANKNFQSNKYNFVFWCQVQVLHFVAMPFLTLIFNWFFVDSLFMSRTPKCGGEWRSEYSLFKAMFCICTYFDSTILQIPECVISQLARSWCGRPVGGEEIMSWTKRLPVGTSSYREGFWTLREYR